MQICTQCRFRGAWLRQLYHFISVRLTDRCSVMHCQGLGSCAFVDYVYLQIVGFDRWIVIYCRLNQFIPTYVTVDCSLLMESISFYFTCGLRVVVFCRCIQKAAPLFPRILCWHMTTSRSDNPNTLFAKCHSCTLSLYRNWIFKYFWSNSLCLDKND